jgi:lipopolysaccharide assembly protein A
MSAITWTVRLAIFLFLLAFAVKNTEPVTLRFFFDLAWQAPLVALLLAFFVAGAALGAAAMAGGWLRQRRELQRLQLAQGAAPQSFPPPAPPAVDV